MLWFARSNWIGIVFLRGCSLLYCEGTMYWMVGLWLYLWVYGIDCELWSSVTI